MMSARQSGKRCQVNAVTGMFSRCHTIGVLALQSDINYTVPNDPMIHEARITLIILVPDPSSIVKFTEMRCAIPKAQTGWFKGAASDKNEAL